MFAERLSELLQRFFAKQKNAVNSLLLLARCLLLVFTALVITGCNAVQAPELRADAVVQLALKSHWQKQLINGEQFDLVAFLPQASAPQRQLIIYIEGDGLAWRNHYTPAYNPTPINPTALKLALQHPTNNAVYLARPCQYVRAANSHHCQQQVWTAGRFSEAVIASTAKAIDVLKTQYQATSLVLVGYSGGGTLAALVAVRRQDVKQLITVAANLDHRAWTDYHHISPLAKSLSLTAYRDRLSSIPQHHFVGADDLIVPAELNKKFLATMPSSPWIVLDIIEGVDHDCCWVEQWPRLITGLEL
ncbi:hypothetical protein [Dasania marina]|uniref:alpha/beta fold hydrolase n=1 Tax=Dasania marina TaxID=471499 RepID=UPI0030DC09A1